MTALAYSYPRFSSPTVLSNMIQEEYTRVAAMGS